MTKTYPHYSVYSGPWRWPNFTPREVSCKHCGELYLDDDAPDALDAIQHLRDLWGKPLIINSAHRCKKHNASVGGTVASQHLKIAFDVACPESEQTRLCKLAIEAGFTGIGRYPKRAFIHLDMGPTRSWWG